METKEGDAAAIRRTEPELGKRICRTPQHAPAGSEVMLRSVKSGPDGLFRVGNPVTLGSRPGRPAGRKIFSAMRRLLLPRQTLIEGGFVVFLLVLCGILTALQYRWTGELSRAALERTRTNLADQAQLLGRAFDAELSKACSQLLPQSEELEARGYEAPHVERLRAWLDTKPRPMFRRLSVAVPGPDAALQLFALDQSTGQLLPAGWPPGWAALRDNLSRKISGRTPPFSDPSGVLIEFPIFGHSTPPNPPAEIAWLIVELDLEYVRTSWLPELAKTYLNNSQGPRCEAVVRVLNAPRDILFSTIDGDADAAASTAAGKAITVSFNRQGRAESDRRFRGDVARWQLTVWHQPGALEAMVAASRWRNLLLSGLLTSLMLASGVALVHFTRRSRQLAEAQMLFVASVSHELRTPLTVIRGAAHNLQRGIIQGRGRIEQYAALIGQHADQLSGMIEQVVEFAAAKRRRLVMPHERVALAEVLSAAIAAATPDAQAARCEVQADIPADLPATEGDAGALRRAFQNLLANAARHGGSGGWIGVTARCVNGSQPPVLEVRVADRGPGIPKEEQAGIFQPFFRGTRSQEKQTRGSGLGLSLVREIVEAHGGGVSVQSRSGEGAIFTVRLPVTAPRDPAATAEEDKRR